MFGKNHHDGRRPKGRKFLLFIGVFLSIAALASWLIMLLWNHILAEHTGVKALNFWKAAGLLLLFKLLFGGIRKRASHRRPFSGKNEWRHKWMEMSKEERMEARNKWKEHCSKKK
jgi:hypothetical protein